MSNEAEHDSLRDTITPKSDQLNADDLMGTTITITVRDVRRGTNDQPVIIDYEGDKGRPYKPCKSMRRVLICAWGDNGKSWIGKSMTLYNDPDVKFGGVMVGGIRISHLSHISATMLMQLTATRGKKAPYRVDPIPYPEALFNERLAAWKERIADGKMTADEVIERCAQTGALSAAQKASIRGGTSQDAPLVN